MILRVACIQPNAKPDLAANLAEIEHWIRAAHADGAQFIATPENTSGMHANRAALIASALPEADHPAVSRFGDLARETGAWLLAGSLSILLGSGKLANRSFLFAPSGDIAARYDKIHMFDADPLDGQAYRESATFERGTEAVVADTTFGRLGLSICYDVRFPALYNALAQGGASMITAPAAFTVPTGKAHWHVLLRARAIETGAFIVAPGQTGEHAGGRLTYGHSLIVSPWGEVLADGGEAEGFVAADCAMDSVVKARQMIRSLDHARPFTPSIFATSLSNG
ncbi:MAG: amidohydrolase [Rhodospirillales bacterium]|nr:amidohydrolase [Rhodospirillales bacterium]